MKTRTDPNILYSVEVEDATFTGAPVTASREAAIITRFTSKEFKKGKTQELTADDKIIGQRFVETVSSWENVTDENEEEIKHSKETVLNFVNLNMAVAIEVLDKFDRVASEVKEKEAKNSKTSQT